MFKKKRIFLILCALAVLGLAWAAGPVAAAACVGGAVVLLGMIKCLRIVTAARGLRTLVELQSRHGVEPMIRRLNTSPAPDDAWNFVVLGDTRNNVTVARTLYRRAAAEAPAMLFHTGDIVRGGGAQELRNNHARLIEEEIPETPVFCVPGNHERGPRRDFAAFTALFGAQSFSFRHGGAVFVGFNNAARQGITDSDLLFLREQLSPAAAHKFVFMHIPPAFFEATFVSDKRRRGIKKNAAAFHELMGECGVAEVFMAHIHGFASQDIDGVRYTLTAGGGAPLSRRLVPEGRCHHLLNIVVTGDALDRQLLCYSKGAWEARAY